jgi:hypothetical protein
MVQQPPPAPVLQIVAVFQDDTLVLVPSQGVQQGDALGPALWLIPTRPPSGPRAAPAEAHEQDVD